MTFTPRLAKIRDVVQHLDERTGLWYHGIDLEQRVLGHAGVPGKRAHMTQNPLARFETDSQPLSETESPWPDVLKIAGIVLGDETEVGIEAERELMAQYFRAPLR